jgi:Asp-tRNA(Asn)/Glu-tRNA(Gln) amidotransferase A subunit family amidase
MNDNRPDPVEPVDPAAPTDRRHFVKLLAGLGVGTAVYQRALAAQVAREGAITAAMVKQAEWVAGVDLTDEEREKVANAIRSSLRDAEALRKVEIGYDVPPCLTFNPAPWLRPEAGVLRNQAVPRESHPPARPENEEALAFLPVTELSALLRTRQVTSTELTKLYLSRLKRFDPLLKCVVTLTEELALKQAARADAEIAAGRYRGPLHGVPWGAKDLIAHPGYKTTWGAEPFREQTIDEKATVAERLEEAGAVLVAKLTLGAIAEGDRWFGGMTRNPWDPRKGSSGSSAGSASAVAAGLVGFAIGSETLGSIVSPSRVCGTTGLRPTFGRVSRAGCMALSWSMDKLGPLARSVEDCALVLDAIHGFDGRDPAAVDHAFAWPPRRGLNGLKVGYIKGQKPADEREELKTLKTLGLDLVPIELPNDYPAGAVSMMLGLEAASAFEDITRKKITEGLNAWPDRFRRNLFVPAMDYLRASRVRTLLIRSMAHLMETVDLYVHTGQDLVVTNLTGHPTVVIPDGFREVEGRRVPFPVMFTGRLFDETTILAVTEAYQRSQAVHLERPPVETFLADQEKAGGS